MPYTISDGFPYYIQLVETDYLELFNSFDRFLVYDKISEQQSTFRYEPGKWSIKQIIGHITDHERIMTYRTLRFSKKDETLLPGYDQDIFMENSRFDEISWEDLVQDFKNVRKATISFMKMLSAEQLNLKGKAWIYELTVEEFLKATIGHELHHFEIIKNKYLQ
jgi:DinB superfamily